MSIFDAEIVKTAIYKPKPESKSNPQQNCQLVRKRAVINKSYGGFKLSDLCIQELQKRGKVGDKYTIESTIPRDDPDLISVVESLGIKRASGDVYGFVMELRIMEFNLRSTQDFTILAEDGSEHIGIYEKQVNQDGKHPIVKIIYNHQ